MRIEYENGPINYRYFTTLSEFIKMSFRWCASTRTTTTTTKLLLGTVKHQMKEKEKKLIYKVECDAKHFSYCLNYHNRE